MGFAMVFKRPNNIPEFRARCVHHSALAGGGHDLVLTKAPSRHIAETANRLTMDASPVSLSTVFDHSDAVGAGEITDGRHVCGPSTQMHYSNGFSAWGDQGSDGGGSNRARLGIHVGEHRLSARSTAGSGGDEGARRGNQLIT